MSEASGDASRPLVTIGLVTYRQESFAREAVRSVLAQTYSPLQVVICDDASPDATFDILTEEVAAYRGEHDVLLRRNPQNLGIGNFNRVMELADGAFVVIAHGDDVSFPHRVERMTRIWRRSGVSLVASNALYSQLETGQEAVLPPETPKWATALELAEHGWTEWLFGGALAWDRKVFDLFGPLDPGKSAVSSDWIIPFRAALLGGIAIFGDPLLKVRVHAQSKRERYLGAQDHLVKRESHAANALTQFLYMLDALDAGVAKGLVPPRPDVRRALVRSILGRAGEWSACRNRLLGQGRRTRWLPIDA